jgi:hypothetical protein
MANEVILLVEDDNSGTAPSTLASMKPTDSMYRDMGMTYWLEKSEAEMRELG